MSIKNFNESRYEKMQHHSLFDIRPIPDKPASSTPHSDSELVPAYVVLPIYQTLSEL